MPLTQKEGKLGGRKEKMKHVGKHVDNVLFVRCVYAHLTFFSSVFFFLSFHYRLFHSYAIEK